MDAVMIVRPRIDNAERALDEARKVLVTFALATLGGTGMVTKVVILFLAIQIIDNVLVQPIVVAKSVDLNPLVVMIVVMIGSDLWGIVGMLIAVPVTGILKVSSVTVYEGLKGYRLT